MTCGDWWRAAALGVVAIAGSAAAQVPAEGRRLIAQGEACLAAGDVDCARRSFEQAALGAHAADIEIGIVRTQMQAGDYRQALAFAAHTAGAHRESPEGVLLYAQLLELGGQSAPAQQLRVGVADVGDRHWAPYPSGESVPPAARRVGSALLLPDGRRAIAPRGALRPAPSVWLRNGLGRTVRAEVEAGDAPSELVLLDLVEPLDVPPTWRRAAREAFAGSAGHVIGVPPAATPEPAWPQLSLGFIGAQTQDGRDRRLGVEVPAGTSGAPVFDVAGRVVGITLPPAADGQPRLAGIGAIEALAGPLPVIVAAPAERLPLDELYERAMRTSLQLLVLP
jgi:hypothetical protein